MISEGFELMVIGMGTVFAFLVMLVFCMKLMGKLAPKLQHIFPEKEAAPSPSPSQSAAAATLPVTSPAADDRAKIAVALAAAHRARN